MSHLKERKENNCLNCNAVIHGKYCSVCGQENIEPKESVWHLINHFFQDITHFDGKFFSSLKYLLFNPGFLSAEYARGRRQAYLNPIRFYIFTSFIFFFIMFIKIDKRKDYNTENAALQKGEHSKKNNFVVEFDPDDDEVKKAITDSIDYNLFGAKGKTTSNRFYFSEYPSRKVYDSLLNAGKIKDNFINRNIIYKQLVLAEKFERDENKLGDALREKFIHNLPLMFLFSLPFFAVFLKLIYHRKRNKFYVAHAIFAIHLYIFTFVAVLLIMLFDYLKDSSFYSVFEFLKVVVILYIIYYYYKALRYFYEQGYIKTAFKFILIFFWLLFVLVFLLIVFFFYTLYKL